MRRTLSDVESPGSKRGCENPHDLRQKTSTLFQSEEDNLDDEVDGKEHQPAVKRARVVETERPAREGGVRRGKWTNEEQAYADRLIRDFEAGLLPLENGATLRAYLSKKLNCDPMRISKKFAGNKCLGKQIFLRRPGGEEADGAPSSSSMYTSTMAPLTTAAGVRDDAAIQALEEAFQRSIASAAAIKNRNRSRAAASNAAATKAVVAFPNPAASATPAQGGAVVRDEGAGAAAKVPSGGSVGSALTLALHGGEVNFSGASFGKSVVRKSLAAVGSFGALRTGHCSTGFSQTTAALSADEGGTSSESSSPCPGDAGPGTFPAAFSKKGELPLQPKTGMSSFPSSQSMTFLGDALADCPDDDSWRAEYFETRTGGLPSSGSSLSLFSMGGNNMGMDASWNDQSTFDDDHAAFGSSENELRKSLVFAAPTSSLPSLLLNRAQTGLAGGSDSPRSPKSVAGRVSAQGGMGLPPASSEVDMPLQPPSSSKTTFNNSGNTARAPPRNSQSNMDASGGNELQATVSSAFQQVAFQQVYLPTAVEPLGDFLPDECFTF